MNKLLTLALLTALVGSASLMAAKAPATSNKNSKTIPTSTSTSEDCRNSSTTEA